MALLVVIGKLENGTWLVGPIQESVSQQNAVADNLIQSWNTEPFIDIVVIDIDTNSSNNLECPVTHPHDVIYSVWPGTRHMCDCLERESDREYYLDIICIKDGHYEASKGEHASEDCFDVESHAPIV